MKPAAKLTDKDDEWFKELPDYLERAVGEYDLPSKGDWSPLDELSSATQFEGIEVYSDSIVREKDQLVASATVYVELVYDPNSEPVRFQDSYPARVFFEVDKEARTVTVNRIEVDTHSFYE